MRAWKVLQHSSVQPRVMTWFLVFLQLCAVAAATLGACATRTGQSNPLTIAVVVPLSGPQSGPGHVMVNGVKLYFDAVNRAGGIEGRPLQALLFDDAASPDTARDRAQEVVASPALAVIGHLVSVTSMAAGPVYQAGQIPAVTASGTADGITADNPYYFRTIFDTSTQGSALGLYARHILGQAHMSIIATTEDFGRSITPAFAASFTEQGGAIRHSWVYDPAPQRQQASLDQIARELAADPEAGMLLLAVSPNTAARDVVVGLRRRGLSPQILGGSSFGSDQFGELFGEFEEEQHQPGFFTDGIYAVAPLIFDSAGERAQEFVEEYEQVYHEAPDLRAAKYYEAAQVLVEALRASGAATAPQGRDADRRRLRDALASFSTPTRAVRGLSGPIYFAQRNTSADVVRVGQFKQRHFISAPVQLATVPNPGLVDLDQELAAGRLFRLGQQYLWRQRVVYTGLDFNQILSLDQGQRSFKADFFLWFRYSGDDDIIAVDFPNAIEQNFNPATPITVRTVEGLKYRLYRVQGEFRSDFDFHDYPFDRQILTVRVQHPRYTREEAVYVVDSLGLPERATQTYSQAFASLESWVFVGMRYFQETLTTHSTRGDPAAFSTGRETQFSSIIAMATLQRQTLTFLVKSLLPLLLLVLVVYVALYFPYSLLKERLTTALSAMLAGAVLLGGINRQLAEVGYTTAIEYGFYGFFGLCLCSTVVTLMAERLRSAKRTTAANRLEIAARVGYPAAVIATVALYLVRFGARLI